MRSKPRVLDLFAGAGGLSLGLAKAGFEIRVAAELDEDAAASYRDLHPRVDVWECDVRSEGFSSLRGEIELVAGGPPCQPWSQGGKGLAQKDPRDGLPAMIRAVKQVKPHAVLIENVPGLASRANRPVLGRLVRQLFDLSYHVVWRVLDAADFSVPQRRARFFLIGTRSADYRFPRRRRGPGTRHEWHSCGSVLGDLMTATEDLSPVTYARKPHIRPTPFQGLLFNGGGRPLDLTKPAPTVLASAGGNRTHFVDTAGIVATYHAQLIAGRRPRRGKVLGARRLTVASSAALQSFSPEARFYGSRSSQFTQVGNAVPPALARAIGLPLSRVVSRG